MGLKMRASSNGGRRGESGYTLLQILITMAIMTIVTTFAVMQIAVARDHIKLTGATHEFARYTEKARLDSIRRHGSLGGGDSTLTLNSTSDYTLLFDNDYNGEPTAKTYTLPEGVNIKEIGVTTAEGTETKVPSSGDPVEVIFDWRGRTANAYRITFTNTRGHESVIGITAAGEVSVDRKPITLTAGSYDANNNDSSWLGPYSAPTPSTTGGGTTTVGGGSTDDGGTTTGGGGPTDGGGTTDDGGTTTAGGGTTTGGTTTQQCSMSLSPASTSTAPIVLHNDNNASASSKTTTITLTFSNLTSTASFNLTQVPNNLNVTTTDTTITITAKNGNGNKGNFSLIVTPPSGCGSAQTIYITVVN